MFSERNMKRIPESRIHMIYPFVRIFLNVILFVCVCVCLWVHVWVQCKHKHPLLRTDGNQIFGRPILWARPNYDFHSIYRWIGFLPFSHIQCKRFNHIISFLFYHSLNSLALNCNIL